MYLLPISLWRALSVSPLPVENGMEPYGGGGSFSKAAIVQRLAGWETVSDYSCITGFVVFFPSLINLSPQIIFLHLSFRFLPLSCGEAV